MKDQDQVKTELVSYINTGYPLLFLFTFEEERAIHLLYEVSREIGIDLVRSRDGSNSFRVDELIHSSKNNSIILVDIIQFSINEKSTIRTLLDCAMDFSNSRKTIVMICPYIEIPNVLERFSAFIYLPLPNDELILNQFIKVESEIGIHISEEYRYRLVHLMRGLSLTTVYLSYKNALQKFNDDFSLIFSSIIHEKKTILKRSRFLECIDNSSSLSEIGGMDRLKDWLSSRKDAFTEEARHFGLPYPRGLMLMGVQGCGKSLMAKSVAFYWQMPLVRLDIASLFGSSSPESHLKEALLVVEAMSEAVLWIDEIEKVFDNSGFGIGSRLFGEFIIWLQEKQKPIFVIATANRVENLPPELIRKGRFDEIFFVDLPNSSERYEIFSIHLRKYGRNPDSYNIVELVKKTEGFSGSEIEQIIISGLYSAFSLKRDLEDADLFRSCKDMVSLFEMYEEEIKSLRDWASKRARFASTDRKKLDLFSN